jgi:limonene-1,2-epoxide hydrolase
VHNPIDTVKRFCAAWSASASAADLSAFFTEDAVYHNIPLTPVIGRDAIAENIASFIRPGPPGIEELELRILHIASSASIVLTERSDHFTLPDRAFELAVMGTFEISEDGQIKAWRDYFDSNQFASRLGSESS